MDPIVQECHTGSLVAAHMDVIVQLYYLGNIQRCNNTAVVFMGVQHQQS